MLYPNSKNINKISYLRNYKLHSSTFIYNSKTMKQNKKNQEFGNLFKIKIQINKVLFMIDHIIFNKNNILKTDQLRIYTM